MTPESQIKALAELDGYDWNTKQDMQGGCWMRRHAVGFVFCEPEKYLTSYDAIIPLIQKQHNDVKWLITEHLIKHHCKQDYIPSIVLLKTPSQLCEALLRATGKWKK